VTERANDLLFGGQLVALLLISAGGEMTEEANRLIGRDVWDELFAHGLAETQHPPDGDAFHRLTQEGRKRLEAALSAAGCQGVRVGLVSPSPASLSKRPGCH
jgi:hypothetical protein